jgi:glycine C-acetyltransferase
MADLEAQLQQAREARFRMIVTDGVFSMDGDVAPLPQICDLADKYDALVFIDECHATGFFGPTGRGTPEFFKVEERVDIINSTLGKALGGATGGYTAASKEVVTLLRQRSRPYLFSNTIAPAVVGASLECLDMVMKRCARPAVAAIGLCVTLSSCSSRRDDLVKKLAGHVGKFRQSLTKAGFRILVRLFLFRSAHSVPSLTRRRLLFQGHPAHPIVPILIGDARLAGQFADAMLKKGIYVIGFSYPVVPVGQARIRCVAWTLVCMHVRVFFVLLRFLELTRSFLSLSLCLSLSLARALFSVQLSAAHSAENIDTAIAAFIEAGRELGIIGAASAKL